MVAIVCAPGRARGPACWRPIRVRGPRTHSGRPAATPQGTASPEALPPPTPPPANHKQQPYIRN